MTKYLFIPKNSDNHVFGKKKEGKDKDQIIDENESEKIRDRLDPGESIIMSARQSRIRPGGAAAINPNTIFITEKRVIIRNPIRLGYGEHIEEYYYHQITNVRLEKGLFSSSLVFAIPGLTEISKSDRKLVPWGRDSEGVIDAIQKEIAEKMYDYIRERIKSEKSKKDGQSQQYSGDEDPIKILKARYARGEISKDEFESMKKDLE